MIVGVGLVPHGAARALERRDDARLHEFLQVPVHGRVRDGRQLATDPAEEFVCRRMVAGSADDAQQDGALRRHAQAAARGQIAHPCQSLSMVRTSHARLVYPVVAS